MSGAPRVIPPWLMRSSRLQAGEHHKSCDERGQGVQAFPRQEDRRGCSSPHNMWQMQAKFQDLG